eukprot:TRINITY_DN104764_c0_g1_i1.p2 TRINITY_DN104764_c0_g1~~TRINITY_DN104764_c0_g1_i1.p2  ORF type:complete len:109 (-),score=12.08 TRINITY_DN104764_c0_g1_i1:76-402(-)
MRLEWCYHLFLLCVECTQTFCTSDIYCTTGDDSKLIMCLLLLMIINFNSCSCYYMCWSRPLGLHVMHNIDSARHRLQVHVWLRPRARHAMKTDGSTNRTETMRQVEAP